MRQPTAATYTYDLLGHLLSTTLPITVYTTGVTTFATYDNAGQKTSSTDGAGNTTRFSYDLDGRLVWTVNPDGSWSWDGYDLAGNHGRAGGHPARSPRHRGNDGLLEEPATVEYVSPVSNP